MAFSILARVRGQDRISSEQVAKICGLKMIQDKFRQKVTMVWSYEKGNGGRSVEISGRNGSIREKESRKTKENLDKYSEEGFGTNRRGRECGISVEKITKLTSFTIELASKFICIQVIFKCTYLK